MRRILILAVAVVGMSVVALPAEAKTVTIETKEFKFVPPTASIAAGDTLVFSNTGATVHNAQAPDGSFKIDIINPGEKKSVVVTKSGTIPYVCTFHETVGMKATLTVAGAAGAEQPAQNPAPGAPADDASPGPAGSPAASTAEVKAAPAAKAPAKPAAPVAAEKPPTEKYFPKIGILLMLMLAPLIGLSYRNRMKAVTAKAAPAPPAAPAEPAG